jgi:hypothetical protein
LSLWIISRSATVSLVFLNSQCKHWMAKSNDWLTSTDWIDLFYDYLAHLLQFFVLLWILTLAIKYFPYSGLMLKVHILVPIYPFLPTLASTPLMSFSFLLIRYFDFFSFMSNFLLLLIFSALWKRFLFLV